MNSLATGIDALERDDFKALRGQRVGLVTNHTGLTRDGRATVDVLHEAPGVTLQALFGPEHGIRGEVDAKFADSSDPRTGLPVFSLYGAHYAPSGEQLADIDTLVFDIQDIGCRFYTYISTLGHVFEAAAQHGRRVVVLDRPNPITGSRMEGPLADADKLNFTAYHSLPVRHGLTTGETARLFCGEKKLDVELEIVPCEGWQREAWYDATGLVWTNPSPNMRSLRAAALYPGLGLLEFTNVSVGRGTDTPFEVFGAPFIQAGAFAAALNDAGLDGVRFLPIFFTPQASVHAGQLCGGVSLLVTDREALNAVQVGLTLAITLWRLYREEWQADRLLALLANQQAFQDILGGREYAEAAQGWADSLADFARLRQKYTIY